MEFVIIAALIISNGILAMSEIALVSLRKSNLALDAKNGSKSAKEALALAENPDNNVILLTINDDRILKNIYYLKEVSPKVKFVNLHCPSGQHPLSFWRVYQAIKMEKPDIVHIHCDLLLAYFPVFFKRKTK